MFVASGGHGFQCGLENGLWFATTPSKRWGEVFFLAYSPFWVIFLLGVIVPFRLYESFQELEYFVVGLVLALPCIVLPLVLGRKVNGLRPWYTSYCIKANLWIGVFGFVGNYFLTHYFYTILGATYTWKSWKLNDVPVNAFLLCQPYFLLYHTAASVTIRRLRNSSQSMSSPKLFSWIIQPCLIVILACSTALTEALAMSNLGTLILILQFPLYNIADRDAFYKVGSLFYALYFIVSYPMFIRIDEEPSMPWTISRTAIDALAASMLVMILLDLWRITLGPIVHIPRGRESCGAHGSSPPWLSQQN